MKNFYLYFLSFCVLISSIIGVTLLKQTNRISVNTYLISPIDKPSVYLTTGGPFFYKSPVPLGSSVIFI